MTSKGRNQIFPKRIKKKKKKEKRNQPKKTLGKKRENIAAD